MRIVPYLLATGLVTTALATSIAVQAPAFAADQPKYDTGEIPSPHIAVPTDGISAMVFLVSGPAGWSAKDDDRMAALVSDGAAVVGIDYKAYMASLAKDDGDCIYMISDIESLSQQIQRHAGDSSYHPPILAGQGDAGALVLAMMAQMPPATVGEAIVVDPTSIIPLDKELCTPATKTPTPNGFIYGLSDDPLPAPTTVIETSAMAPTDKAHVDDIRNDHKDVAVIQGDDSDGNLLINTVLSHIDATSKPTNVLDLPLTELETKPTMDTMAVFYSGDGGWRDIDMEVGQYLQSNGMPVIGLDSLRYFWTKKDPKQIASDLSHIIETYRKKWKVKNVVLIGYSFGADILPTAYSLLPPKDQATVKQISLMALSHSIDFEISVSGWFGAKGKFEGGNTIDAVSKIDPKLVQCIYGTDDDDDDACPELKAKGYETIAMEGDHHFNDAYDKVGDVILNGLKTRQTD